MDQAKRLTHLGRKDDADQGGAHILLTTRVPNLLAIIPPLTATHRYHKNKKQEAYASPNHLPMIYICLQSISRSLTSTRAAIDLPQKQPHHSLPRRAHRTRYNNCH